MTELVDVYGHKRRITACCTTCYGSREMMGGGMMRVKCTSCVDGYNSVPDSDTDKPVLKTLDKRSKQYKEAVQELVSLGLNKEEAHEKLANGLDNGKIRTSDKIS
jgi:hypothetical protein